jgi:hypothetical protein
MEGAKTHAEPLAFHFTSTPTGQSNRRRPCPPLSAVYLRNIPLISRDDNVAASAMLRRFFAARTCSLACSLQSPKTPVSR